MCLLITEQLYQNIKIFRVDVPATEPVRAVPKAGELLFSVPSSAPTYPSYQQFDAHHHSYPLDWGARSHCRQRRL